MAKRIASVKAVEVKFVAEPMRFTPEEVKEKLAPLDEDGRMRALIPLVLWAESLNVPKDQISVLRLVWLSSIEHIATSETWDKYPCQFENSRLESRIRRLGLKDEAGNLLYPSDVLQHWRALGLVGFGRIPTKKLTKNGKKGMRGLFSLPGIEPSGGMAEVKDGYDDRWDKLMGRS